jgi:hypothetical protein
MKGTAIDFHVPTGGSISAKTVGIFAAIGALLGGADGATAAGFREAVIFAIVVAELLVS